MAVGVVVVGLGTLEALGKLGISELHEVTRRNIKTNLAIMFLHFYIKLLVVQSKRLQIFVLCRHQALQVL